MDLLVTEHLAGNLGHGIAARHFDLLDLFSGNRRKSLLDHPEIEFFQRRYVVADRVLGIVAAIDEGIFQAFYAGVDVFYDNLPVWLPYEPAPFDEVERELVRPSHANVGGHADPCNVLFDKSAIIFSDPPIFQRVVKRIAGVFSFDMMKTGVRGDRIPCGFFLCHITLSRTGILKRSQKTRIICRRDLTLRDECGVIGIPKKCHS